MLLREAALLLALGVEARRVRLELSAGSVVVKVAVAGADDPSSRSAKEGVARLLEMEGKDIASQLGTALGGLISCELELKGAPCEIAPMEEVVLQGGGAEREVPEADAVALQRVAADHRAREAEGAAREATLRCAAAEAQVAQVAQVAAAEAQGVEAERRAAAAQVAAEAALEAVQREGEAVRARLCSVAGQMVASKEELVGVLGEGIL